MVSSSADRVNVAEEVSSAEETVTWIINVPAVSITPVKVKLLASKVTPLGREEVPCLTAVTVSGLFLKEQKGPIVKENGSLTATV